MGEYSGESSVEIKFDKSKSDESLEWKYKLTKEQTFNNICSVAWRRDRR